MVDTKISFQAVTKIFGPDPSGRAGQMLRSGESKQEILETTGHVVALDDVSFDVREGETFVVMGLSGSGKSTLIRTVNRLVEPTWGHVYVDGDDVMQMTASELREVRGTKLGMVFQHFALFPHRSVRENVGYALRIRGAGKRDWESAADDALELVGLSGWGDYLPANLSGGMQQRVGLARALAADPPILLLDEAFSALDPLIRRQMQHELMQIQEELHKTILFITHDLNEALRVGDRVCIMRDGEVIQAGTPEEIVTAPTDAYVADFIRDVDQARVLGVDFVTTDAVWLPAEGATVEQAYKALARSDLDAVYVVDGDRAVVGVVTIDDIERARSVGGRDLASIVRSEYPETTSTATIAELYSECGSGLPVAVIDASTGRLTGVVDPLHVLTQLGLIESIGDDVSSSNGGASLPATAVDGAGEPTS